MGPKLLLRISAVLMFVHALFHMLGHMQWKMLSSPAYDEVVRQMTGPKFLFYGAMHSMGDYFDGYGYFITLAVVLLGCLLWALSDIAIMYPLVGLKLLIPITILIIFLFFDTLIFFFPLASIYCGLCSISCTMTIVKLSRLHLAGNKATV
jgi:hypothetical protein